MFNPWGMLLIVLGALAIYIGIKGTQGSVYQFITGKQMQTQQPSGATYTQPTQWTTPSGFGNTVQNAATYAQQKAQEAAAALSSTLGTLTKPTLADRRAERGHGAIA
jgi:hypothetical protein